MKIGRLLWVSEAPGSFFSMPLKQENDENKTMGATISTPICQVFCHWNPAHGWSRVCLGSLFSLCGGRSGGNNRGPLHLESPAAFGTLVKSKVTHFIFPPENLTYPKWPCLKPEPPLPNHHFGYPAVSFRGCSFFLEDFSIFKNACTQNPFLLPPK